MPPTCLPDLPHSGRPARTAGAAARPRGAVALTALVVLAVLTVAGVAAWHLHARNVAADAQHFDMLTTRLHDEMLRRIKVYQAGLNGTRSAFAVNEHITRDAFRTILEARDFDAEFPAATGLGYIDRVPDAELPDYLARVRADGAPDFLVRPLADGTAHDDHLLIRYIEPMERKGGVVGTDIGQEPQRRAAAEYAARTGEFAITARVNPVQADGRPDRARFLMLLPHFRPDLPHDTPARRAAALKGWVFMAMSAEPLFAGLTGLVGDELDFEVFDDHAAAADGPLYVGHHRRTGAASRQPDVAPHPRAHDHDLRVKIGGRTWRVVVRSTPRFRAASSAAVWSTAGSGLVLATLLALLLQSQSTSLRRSQALAHAMTDDLRQAALTDRLTDLPNRTAVLPRVDEALHRAQRAAHHHYAVLFLDVDRFKIINDSLGHAAGDELLRKVGRRIRDTLRAQEEAGPLPAGHVAARLGGDEFIVLLDGLTRPDDGVDAARRLLDVLSQPYRLAGRDVVATVSIGVVNATDAYTKADEIVRDADTAMYEAKAAGRGGCVVFDTAMRTRVTERLNLETDLRRALTQEEFFLVYQPIVSLDTAEVVSCEALVRWQHPRRGLIPPDNFIPIAEEIGLIVPLSEWVLNAALAQFAAWRDTAAAGTPPAISVNLSRCQLVLPDLFDVVETALQRHGVNPRHLQLEMTESQIMQERQAALANLDRLRAAGIRIAIDDFGTGYSSLACLHEFPIDVLKIDRAFVADLESDAARVTLLQTVAGLARNLGKQVVAEGIETEAQLHCLRELACQSGQGYLFSRPLAAPDFAAYCSRQTVRRAA